jgi:L-seryl-tRNA(Ser) seleniumtransferase
MVTSGAAGAMMLATAAAVTRGEPDRIARLPDIAGMKNEVITQKTHHTCYDNQITNCGVKLIDVETRADLERAVNDRTAMMLFYNLFEPDGRIKRAEWVDIARRHKIPTLLDAAADVPPLAALSKYTKMGFDMVAFSGGKALMGPNDTGLLLGRKTFIEAAKLNAAPRCGNIGRMMKVGKEDMVAAWAAVKRYVHTDHASEWREWERRISVIERAVASIPTLTTERFVPPIANHVPHVILQWDESRVRINHERIKEQLEQGDPPIAIGRVRGTGDRGLLISVFMLKPGEERIVADRLREIFKRAAT